MPDTKTEINVLEDNSDISQLPEKIQLEENKENVVILEAFQLVDSNTIQTVIDTNSETYQTYYNWMNQKEISILANVRSNSAVSSSFSTYAQRNQIINDLYQKILNGQYRGICIQFEKIDDVNSFYRFLLELTPKFKEAGLKVVVKSNEQLDSKKLEGIVDYVIEEEG